MKTTSPRKLAYIHLGPHLFRVIAADAKRISLITAHVVASRAFDSQSPQRRDGDNRWRDSVLRHWLNSEAPAGSVDFGPHPRPALANVSTCQILVIATREFKDVPDDRACYDGEAGFLHGFSPAERAALIPTELVNDVVSGYGSNLKSSSETTTDRVFLCSFEEFTKVPKALKEAPVVTAFGSATPAKKHSSAHWSRSPVDGLGVAVLELPHAKQKARSNSGASVGWGIRPRVELRADVALTGTGTEKKPYRLA